MNSFVSFKEQFQALIQSIVLCPSSHAKWLNTLSFLENVGARKIAACEHPLLVKEEMLKHAAEEFRHAHYLKRQIGRVTDQHLIDYSLNHLLGGRMSKHYLDSLDFQTSRYLFNLSYSKEKIQELAYLLVTYAIELRASELYPLYEEILRKQGSKVTVKSILLEEKGHLMEMEEELKKIPSSFVHAEKICAIETNICRKWLIALDQALA